MSRRLLMVGLGLAGGSFTAPGGGSDPVAGFEVAAAPQGGWTWFSDPRAVSYNGYTYIGYMRGDNHDVVIVAVNESTLTPSAEVVLHAAMENDDHDNPGLYIRQSDHRLIAFYSRHLGSSYYKRVSTTSLDTDPTLADGFASEVDLDAALGGSNYTYANPVGTSNADGVAGEVLWVFHREHIAAVAHWYYAVSSNGGMTWSANVDLHTLTYSRVVSNGVGRIDVVASTHPNGNDDADVSKVRHLYRESSAWHKSDGTTIGGGVPIAKTSMTTVYDSGGDPVWIWDIAYDSDGHPCIAFVVFASTSDHRYWYAHWTGSAWDTHLIVAAGGYIPTAAVGGNPIEAYYSGGMALDHDDPAIVYASIGTGSDEWQMRRYVTTDHGATWSYSVLTSGGKNVRPASVRDHGDELQVVWMTGPYDSYVDYDVGTTGAGT